jgi:hypothetical protein
MSNHTPPSDAWDERPTGDAFNAEEEAIYPNLSDDESMEDDWDNEYDSDDYDHEDYTDEDLYDESEVDASLYEDPVPPMTDRDFVQEDLEVSRGDWLKENWWRLAIVVLLILLIIAMLAKACTGKNEKAPPIPTIIPTKVILPTLTPTMAAQATATPIDSGSQAPAAEPTLAPTPEPQATVAVAPAPATGGKFNINQAVVVTGTDRDKLSFRAGPGIGYNRLRVIKDGVQLIVIGGPQKADGYTWWQLKTPKGEVGWAVENYLK